MSDKFNNPWGDNRGNNPDDLDKMIKKGQDKVINFLNNVGKSKKGRQDPPEFPIKNFSLVVIFVALISWLSTGFYTIQPDEAGVILRLGQYHRTSVPGLNYKLPSPLEKVEKVSVTRINREEIGYKSSAPISGRKFFNTTYQADNDNRNGPLEQESEMLTGDENILSIDFEVQWRIKNARDYLFNVKDTGNENTVKISAASAMREVIGISRIADALAGERYKIELKAKAVLQEMLDNYAMGVEVLRVQMLRVEPPSEVIDAYRDVQSAKADKEREINQSEAYNNDIIPRARGKAARIIKDAQAYKQKVLAKAQGEASRFNEIYTHYKTAKEVVRKRMYLETMEKILAGMNKIILDPNERSNLLPLISLNDINNKNKQERVK